MRGLTVFILLLGCGGAANAVEIKNDYFWLDLPGDWRQERTVVPSQFVVTSRSSKAQITLSYLPISAQENDLQRIADRLFATRKNALREVDRTVVFHESWSSKPADGGIQVNFIASDRAGRRFFYVGFVTQTHVTSVTGELEFRSNRRIREFYRKVLSHFSY